MTKRALVVTGERRVFQVVEPGNEKTVEQPFEWVDVDDSVIVGDYITEAFPSLEHLQDNYYDKTEADARFHPLGKMDSRVDVSGDRTFQLSDIGKMIRATGSSAHTFTIPADTFAGDEVLNILQWGTGQITFVAASGATLHYEDDTFINKSLGQMSMQTIYFVGANNPVLGGQLELA